MAIALARRCRPNKRWFLSGDNRKERHLELADHLRQFYSTCNGNYEPLQLNVSQCHDIYHKLIVYVIIIT
jgi:hypothetical protein